MLGNRLFLLLIGGINVSDFHIVLIFNEYYTQIVAVFDETDAEQKQKQTCCKPTQRQVSEELNVQLCMS